VEDFTGWIPFLSPKQLSLCSMQHELCLVLDGWREWVIDWNWWWQRRHWCYWCKHAWRCQAAAAEVTTFTRSSSAGHCWWRRRRWGLL